MIRTSMHSLSSCLLACFSIVGTLVAIAPSYGTIVTINLGTEFSGGTEPAGTAPWLQATFDDEDPNLAADTVRLTMADVNLTGNNEHVKEWNFNLDPSFDPNDLVFSAPHSAAGVTEGAIVVSAKTNDFQANGDGFFDIMFVMPIQNGPSTKFGSGDTVSFDISGIAGLTANSFNFFSFQDGGQGSHPSAAQVLGIGPNDESGWVGIPEPTSGMLLLAGCFAGGLFAGRRKRR